jgi:hypothetical protein
MTSSSRCWPSSDPAQREVCGCKPCRHLRRVGRQLGSGPRRYGLLRDLAGPVPGHWRLPRVTSSSRCWPSSDLAQREVCGCKPCSHLQGVGRRLGTDPRRYGLLRDLAGPVPGHRGCRRAGRLARFAIIGECESRGDVGVSVLTSSDPAVLSYALHCGYLDEIPAMPLMTHAGV